MKKLAMKSVLACLLAGCLYCVVEAKAQNLQTQADGGGQTRVNTKSSRATSRATSEGEMRFEAHCGRCHNPPEDLSPREARAVIRQMRVRAMLSAEDERLILGYIAP